MGYSTDFKGSFSITPPISVDHANYIRAFNKTRKMKLKVNDAESFPDPFRKRVNLPLGVDGAYFANPCYSSDFVLDHNEPPSGQPGLWCQWTVPPDSSTLEWDRGEKFYKWIPWLRYLIDHFFGPWNYRLNGQVYWNSEDGTCGTIVLKDNAMEIFNGVLEVSEEN